MGVKRLPVQFLANALWFFLVSVSVDSAENEDLPMGRSEIIVKMIEPQRLYASRELIWLMIKQAC